ncbi:hypothetical protein MKX03_015565 [Papaver bracteatum]|nr:hypothetical protein MKX03_015565 [Papaver bracteatum]
MEETLDPMISNIDLDNEDPYFDLERKSPPIFRIPDHIKEKNRKLYEPQVVSIGPYHYGKPKLMPMQIHKKRAVAHFVKRSGKSIQFYLDRLMEDVKHLKECYEGIESIQEWQDDANFVRLMMVDGVFLFEFLSVLRGSQKNDYASIDPIFGQDGHILVYDSMMQDFLLLENQLPYQVLSTLLSVSEGLPEEGIQSVLSWMMFAPKRVPGLHLLDMYIKGLVGEGQTSEEEEEVERFTKYSASKLCKYGIKFKRVQSVHRINFDKRSAILKLPSILINSYTVSKFHNLMAYELRVIKGKDLNSYIRLISTLVQSSKDVMLLQSEGIIVSSMASESVVEVVKELAKVSVVDLNCKFSLVIEEVRGYSEENASRYLRRFLDNWAPVSVLVVAVLLVLCLYRVVF